MELLIVVIIIGLLSAIVLASMNSAKEKGRIAGVKSSMKSFINQVSIITDGSNLSQGYFYNTCPTTTATAGGTILADQKLMDIFNEARAKGGGQAYCVININSSGKWVIAVDLPNKTTVWCVDYKNTAKQLPGGQNYGTYGNAIDTVALECK